MAFRLASPTIAPDTQGPGQSMLLSLMGTQASIPSCTRSPGHTLGTNRCDFGAAVVFAIPRCGGAIRLDDNTVFARRIRHREALSLECASRRDCYKYLEPKLPSKSV
mmetsp:Transcript_63625/g.138387  ORF Transcript_63625/g.138387 Transcript_63625/m.138387 type:complete len:107 (-) Transcript_63625:109-429(-)